MLRSRIAGFVVAATLALVSAFPAPARAAVDADFNHDGVTDRVHVSSTDARLVVRVSGKLPQVLPHGDRLISIVAVDVNHDGHLDLGALSERRRLFIWINKGGKGRFTLLRKKHPAAPHAFHGEASLQLLQSPDERPLAQQSRPDADPVVRAVRITAIGSPPSQSLPQVPRDLRTDRGRTALSTPRAPPAHA